MQLNPSSLFLIFFFKFVLSRPKKPETNNTPTKQNKPLFKNSLNKPVLGFKTLNSYFVAYIIVIMTPAHFVIEAQIPYFYSGANGKKKILFLYGGKEKKSDKPPNLEIPISLFKELSLGTSFELLEVLKQSKGLSILYSSR